MAVLWLIAILAMASITALRVIAFDMDVAAANIHGARARHFAEMGIAIGSHPMVDRDDPLLIQRGEGEDGREGGGDGFSVRLISEGSRFNINAIIARRDTDLMNALLMYWGMEQEEAEALNDALTDWIDADNEASLNGAEEDEYLEMGRINQPFNRPFYSLDEMRLVRGMDRLESLRPDWRKWFTVWSSGQLDLNDAPAEFIAVAAECPVEQAQLVVESVCGRDGIRDTDDDMPFQDTAAALVLLGIDPNLSPQLAGRFTVNDPTTRIESIGQAGDARRRITVVVRNRTGKPALLERTEEILP